MPLIELTAPRANISITPDKFDILAESIRRLETIVVPNVVGGQFTRVWLIDGTFVDCEEDRATIRELT